MNIMINDEKEYTKVQTDQKQNSEKNNNSLFSFEKIKYYEQRNYHPLKTPIYFVTLVVVLLYAFIKGSSTVDSIIGLNKCHYVQFIILGVVFLIILLIQILSMWIVYKEQKVKIENNDLLPHEIKFTSKKIIIMVFFGFGIGFIANILGLGGALFFLPVLSKMGVSPIVASSSIMFLIFLSKIAALVLAFVSGYANFDYILIIAFFISFSVVGSLLFLDYFMKR